LEGQLEGCQALAGCAGLGMVFAKGGEEALQTLAEKRNRLVFMVA
jgi:hypothetical protein